MKKLIIILVGLIILAIAYYLLSPFWRNNEINEPSPVASVVTQPQESMPAPGPKVVAKAEFIPKAHDVKGQALLIEENGQHTIRFENFDTINGPDVNIYLASELNDKDFVDLGDIKATQGNINYAVPPGTDVNKYNKVLVWCRAFSVLFSYAELK